MSKYAVGVCLDVNDGLYQDLFSYWSYYRQTFDKKIRFQDFIIICLACGIETIKNYDGGNNNESKCK